MRKSNHMAQKQKYYLVMTLCLGWIIFLIFFFLGLCKFTCPALSIGGWTPFTPLSIKFLFSSDLYQVLNTRHYISDGCLPLAINWQYLNTYI